MKAKTRMCKSAKVCVSVLAIMTWGLCWKSVPHPMSCSYLAIQALPKAKTRMCKSAKVCVSVLAIMTWGLCWKSVPHPMSCSYLAIQALPGISKCKTCRLQATVMYVMECKGSIKLGNEIPHPFAMSIHMRGCWVSCHNIIALFGVEPFAPSCFLCTAPTTKDSNTKCSGLPNV